VQRERLKPAIWLCGLLFLGLLLLLVYGCAVRNLPGGGTAPATTFEKILAWNAALAQANDGIASNVIALQQSGVIPVTDAKTILVKQAAIAVADKRITERIISGAACATQSAGPNATAAQIDAAAATCAKGYGAGLAADAQLILAAIADVNSSGLLGIKDPVKRQALSDLLATVQNLVHKIYTSLENQGVIKVSFLEVQPCYLSS
jgi:hypothetical protein